MSRRPSPPQRAALASAGDEGRVWAPDRTLAALARAGWVDHPAYTDDRRGKGCGHLTEAGRAVIAPAKEDKP